MEVQQIVDGIVAQYSSMLSKYVVEAEVQKERADRMQQRVSELEARQKEASDVRPE